MNVALNKECQQSSIYTDYGLRFGPQTAVDGDTNSDMGTTATCATTVLNQHPHWWAVNLGSTYSIDHITIYCRADCCGACVYSYLHNLYIKLQQKSLKIPKS